MKKLLFTLQIYLLLTMNSYADFNLKTDLYLGTSYYNIDIMNNYAYLTDINDGLQIIDISDTNNTVLKSTYSQVVGLNSIPIGISILGDYAYIITNADTDDMHIINISNPENPQLTATYSLAGIPRNIKVVGDYAYIKTTRALQVINISNPAQPTFADIYYDPDSWWGQPTRLDISTHYAYTVSNNNSGGDETSVMKVFDISNPNNIILMSQFEDYQIINKFDLYSSFTNAENISTVGNYAYLSCGTHGLSIIDVSIPAHPVFISNLMTPYRNTQSVIISGDYAYHLNNYDLYISDISNPKMPVLVTKGRSKTSAYFRDITMYDGILYLVDAEGGITLLKISDIESINKREKTKTFIKRFYNVILSRSADSSGLSYWTDQLTSLSKSAADIAKGFIFSSEYDINSHSDEEYLTTLYHAFFNREPDIEGFNQWKKLILSGTTREEVLEGFLNSEEFTILTKSYGIIANATLVELFISRFYTQILLRDPDPTGLADWTNKLNSGAASASDIAFGFIFSSEFTTRNLDESEYLLVLYKAFFAREADAQGFQSWIEQFNSGATTKEVLQGFLDSTEFSTLTLEYGIRVK